jgi:hypothetical protein
MATDDWVDMANTAGTADITGEPTHRYARAFLLSPEKRNQMLALWEVARYGLDSYGDPDYVCLYGMRPAEWYGRGIRLLARTTIECTRDVLVAAIGEDIARLIKHAPPVAGYTIIDPFARSCNTLYWIPRHVPSARGLASELDPAIYAMTRTNLASPHSVPRIRWLDPLTCAVETTGRARETAWRRQIQTSWRSSSWRLPGATRWMP